MRWPKKKEEPAKPMPETMVENVVADNSELRPVTMHPSQYPGHYQGQQQQPIMAPQGPYPSMPSYMGPAMPMQPPPVQPQIQLPRQIKVVFEDIAQFQPYFDNIDTAILAAILAQVKKLNE